jgi:hypothetical protein
MFHIQPYLYKKNCQQKLCIIHENRHRRLISVFADFDEAFSHSLMYDDDDTFPKMQAHLFTLTMQIIVLLFRLLYIKFCKYKFSGSSQI